MSQTILFLCTGNYYRSRFAEMFFNSLASRRGLRWKAVSRGLELGIHNIGPVYPLVLDKLERMGIPADADLRLPMELVQKDLEHADIIIALDAIEHKLLMAQRFAKWVDQISYWDVPDLHLMEAEAAFVRIETYVTSLIQKLLDQIAPAESRLKTN